MDFLSAFRTFRRHWLAALPVLALTGACLVYVVAIRELDFETTANVVLISPPAPPIDAEGNPILRTPQGKTENPLTSFGDQAVVVDIVSRAVSSDANREKLKIEGADTRYEVGPGTKGPIAEITAVGKSAEQAALTANLVAESFVQNLAAVQNAQGVDPTYFISTLQVEPPEAAKPKLSSTIRLAIGVLGLGLLATFFVVSLAEAWSTRRPQNEDADDGTAAVTATGPDATDVDDGSTDDQARRAS